MTIELNHTIVWCSDKQKSASFIAQILGLPAPTRFGPFLVVELANRVSLDFYQNDGETIYPQHYAFLLSEQEFDAVFGRIRERQLTYWADPARERPGEINHHFGGRGCYFHDPDRHLMEIITRPYGSDG